MSHEELLIQLADSLRENAKARRIRVEKLKIDGRYAVVRRGKITEIEIDVALILDVSFGVLFIFEAKTGVKEDRARKQLKSYKRFLLRSRDLLFYVLEFNRVEGYWVSQEENRVVHIESGREIALPPDFLEDPCAFLLG